MAAFTVLDWVLLAGILVSALASLFRGFVREALSLAAWVAALFVAAMFAPGMESLLADLIASDELRRIAAFMALFVATLVMGSLLTYVVVVVVRMAGLGLLDRLLGMAFGAVRGVLAAVVAVMVVRAALEAAGERPDWFANSVLVPHLLLMENWLRDTVQPVADWIRGITK